jgi:hypothetical protein
VRVGAAVVGVAGGWGGGGEGGGAMRCGVCVLCEPI